MLSVISKMLQPSFGFASNLSVAEKVTHYFTLSYMSFFYYDRLSEFFFLTVLEQFMLKVR